MTRDEPEIAGGLLDEVGALFARHGIPEAEPGGAHSGACHRILMVSTHGYWSDPPPAGATDTGGQTLYVLQISRECARAGRKVLILVRWFAPYARVDPLEDGLWLVRIPAGKFRMGSPEGEAGRNADEGPQHEVRITQPFYMGKYPVTKGDFAAFVTAFRSGRSR